MNIRAEIDRLPISNSQGDLRERIDFVFSLIDKVEASSADEIAQAFSDVISYQSYAGPIPPDCELRLLNWIDQTYDENESYIDSVASIFCMMSSSRALDKLKEKAAQASEEWTRRLFQEAINEFEVNT